jgi:acetyl esterase/lipase
MTAGCAAGEAPVPASALKGETYGTDAQLTASAPDAVLRYADHPRGFAELRLPQGKGPFPLAVMFHGGCWKTGIANQAYMASLATRWQQLGIASLNVDYREVGDGGGWPGSFADWAAAARLIDKAARKYPIDRRRVTLVGHSAGALPALWLAENQGDDGPLGKRHATKARAAIVLDGPADIGLEQGPFDALCEFSSVAPFMDGLPADRPLRYAAIAPQAHAPRLQEVLFVTAVLPPPPAAAQAAIRAGGARVSVLENPGVGHFEILTPGGHIYQAVEPALLRVLRSEQ